MKVRAEELEKLDAVDRALSLASRATETSTKAVRTTGAGRFIDILLGALLLKIASGIANWKKEELFCS